MAALLNMETRTGGASGGGWRKGVGEMLNITGLGRGRSSGRGTPKLDHDRCDRYVQLRLYTMSKGQFALVIAVFLLVFVIFLMIGLAGPPITATRQRRASELASANTTNLAIGPILVSSPILSAYCQQLWVIARFYISGWKQTGSLHEIYEASFQASTEVLATKSYVDLANREQLITQQQANKAPVPDQRGTGRNWSVSLHCEDEACDELIMAHLGFVEYSQYHFVFRFYGLQGFTDRFIVQDIVFYFKSYNASFTRLEIWFRMTFVVLASLITVWYYQNLSPYPLSRWSIEQKWLAILMPMLVLFNNPLFPLVILYNGFVPSALDSLFQSTFLCSILLFWLCVYHGIKQTNRGWLTFYIPKLTLVSLLLAAAVTVSILHRSAALSGVASSGRANLETSQGFRIFLYVVGSLYLLYLVVLVIRAYKELRSLVYFDLRLKFFTIFMLLVIIVTVSISARRFGLMPVLEDNFVSHLSTSYGSSAEFMAFYGLLNSYLITMAFVYSPNPNVVAEMQMIDHDQPPPSAAALLNNDSEDDLFSPEMTGRNNNLRGANFDDGD